MSDSPPPFTEEQKQQYRRYFAALREHNLREREWARQEVVDPARCRAIGDSLWRDSALRWPDWLVESPEDDEAEARVARAIVAVGTHRASRSGTRRV